jgi:hypothetical protein
MLKDVISKLDYAFFDEVAVVLFASCFIAILWSALRLTKDSAMRFSQIPIDERVVDPWKGQDQ